MRCAIESYKPGHVLYFTDVERDSSEEITRLALLRIHTKTLIPEEKTEERDRALLCAGPRRFLKVTGTYRRKEDKIIIFWVSHRSMIYIIPV